MTLNLIAKGSGYYFVGKLQAILFLLLQKKTAIFGILSKLDFRFSNPNWRDADSSFQHFLQTEATRERNWSYGSDYVCFFQSIEVMGKKKKEKKRW